MDFWKLKEKALKLKDEAVKASKDALDKTAQKLRDSDFVIKEKEDIEKFIKEKKKVAVIFSLPETEFYRKSLLLLPVLYTKTWANNYNIKMFECKDEKFLKKEYNLNKLPSMVLIEEKEVIEIIEWEEEVMKVVKNLNLDVEWVANKK